MTPTLHTSRLLLRPVKEDDLDAMLAIRNAPGVLGRTRTGGRCRANRRRAS